jgi:biopolymer transport protein ExbD
MASLLNRSMQRRAERAPLTAAQHLNLVPLVDILTSIVFFSLLTYTGEVVTTLTSFDLQLPPVVVTQEQVAAGADVESVDLLLVVRIQDGNLRVEHSEEGGFRREIPGIGEESLDQFQALMTEIRTRYSQNNEVLVVPSDEISYDNVIKVLERLRMARYGSIALGSRSRQNVTTGGR